MKHGRQRVRKYRVFEGLRIASCLTFISGYLNAFTYLTQGGRFAGVQSGNVILLANQLGQGNFTNTIHFLIPIFFFVCGQFFTYLVKNYFLKRHYPWHLGSSVIMLCFVLIAVILTPVMSSFYTMAILAFVASIQVETFRTLRGVPYANVMMTGNVKNAAFIWFKGIIEKNKKLIKIGRNIFITIISFMLGVICATILSRMFHEYALVGVTLPMMYVTYKLWQEKNPT